MARSSHARKAQHEAPPPLDGVRGGAAGALELDRIIHERVRLAIVSALAANEKLSFGDLKSLLNASDGNISVHARKLEEAGYITCEKSFKGRTPLTEYAITTEGRAELAKYLDHMEALINAMRNV